jgi:hypothetical protein
MSNRGLVGVGTTVEEGRLNDIIRIPPRFMSKDATQEEKKMCSDLIEVVRKLNNIKDNRMNQENTKHKFHEVLQWIAQGEDIEVRVGSMWCKRSEANILYDV